MNKLIESVTQLLTIVPRPPGTAIPGPASTGDLNAFRQSIGYEIPPDLRDWLNISNGPCVGPGGLFGIGLLPKHLSIDHHLSLYPEWGERRWLPIAGDGSGNYYLLAASEEFGGGHPIVFVEPIVDKFKPIYVAASNIWSFLDFLLRRELNQSKWPFDQAEVLACDPDILTVVGVSLPWEA